MSRVVAPCRMRIARLAASHVKAKLSVTFVSEIENDRRAPGTEPLLSVAEALGAPL